MTEEAVYRTGEEKNCIGNSFEYCHC